MSSEYEQATDQLLSEGYAYLSFDSTLVDNARDAFKLFLRSLGKNKSRWSLKRPGEETSDVGVVEKDGQLGFDNKTYFHLSHDLPMMADRGGAAETRQQLVCLRTMNKLHDALKIQALNITLELIRRCHVQPELTSLINDTFRLSRPHNVSTLRLLLYPDIPGQTGAKEHFDKSWLSLHLGDDGGEIMVLDASGQWVKASPPRGSLLFFFGVKALALSNGELKPLRHKSTTLPGKERTAAVMFVHADVGHVVSDAEAAYRHFHHQRV